MTDADVGRSPRFFTPEHFSPRAGDGLARRWRAREPDVASDVEQYIDEHRGEPEHHRH